MGNLANFIWVVTILAAVQWIPVECESEVNSPLATLISLLARIEKLEKICGESGESSIAGPSCSLSFVDVSKVKSDNGLVFGGVYKDGGSSSPLFYCRANVSGAIVPGMAWKLTGSRAGIECYVTYDGSTKRTRNKDLEVMIVPENHNFAWLRKATGGAFPTNAVVGGSAPDSSKLYVARCKVLDDTRRDYTLGWVGADKTKAVTYGINGPVSECTDYDILVCRD